MENVKIHKNLNQFLTPHIISLDFSNNPINESQFSMFNILTQLKIFELRSCGLNSMKSIKFETFIRLIKLDLSYNNLTEVTMVVKDLLEHLEYLDLSHNRISFLSESLFSSTVSFKPLKYLNLEQNQIYFMSGNMYNLINLAILKLNSNFVSSLPDFDSINSGNFVSTFVTNNYEFYFDHNQITKITKLSYWLYKLLVLNFDWNQINSIELDAFKSLKTLEHLSMAQNNLSSLSVNNFFNLIALKFLNLSFNRIRSIEQDSFVNLHKLLILDLSFNEILAIDNQALNGLNRLNDFYLLLNANMSILLSNHSLRSLTNLSNFYLNATTVVLYKCLLLHSLQRYTQRNVSNKYMFYKSINFISPQSHGNFEFWCWLKFEFLQFNLHLNLKSDDENEIFYELCGKSIVIKQNGYCFNYRKCFDKSNGNNDDEEFIIGKGLTVQSKKFVKILSNLWFWAGICLFLVIVLKILIIIWVELEGKNELKRMVKWICNIKFKVFRRRMNLKFFIFILFLVVLVCFLCILLISV